MEEDVKVTGADIAKTETSPATEPKKVPTTDEVHIFPLFTQMLWKQKRKKHEIKMKDKMKSWTMHKCGSRHIILSWFNIYCEHTSEITMYDI
uniref:Uncharacterized protein n=1 Tax=Lactuca sativa TaxID=4236 RepID=A0A9R1V6N6_LACSA|nr:hypothetical protein LSAT_V11C600304980 [Lactuca sativa]